MNEDHIPETLAECIEFMITFVPPYSLEEFRQCDEEYCELGHPDGNWGQWIRNAWGLWDVDSPLTKWFAERDVYHADDKSAMIMKALYKHLNGDDYDFDADVKMYESYWNNLKVDVKKEMGFK